MINYALLEERSESLASQFAAAKPFRWLFIDDFLMRDTTRNLADDFEPVMTRANKDSNAIKKHTHVLRKRGVVRLEQMEASHRALFEELASERFLSLVSKITGIAPLYADPELVGGGLHEIFPGGYLNVHTDFNVHPKTGKHRRLNILIYLNDGWKNEWKGALELWPADNSVCTASIAPVGGRMALFETSEISFHGHPEPLACPIGTTRKSLAAYYYSEWPTGVSKREKTNYRLTPIQYADLSERVQALKAARKTGREIIDVLSTSYQPSDIKRVLQNLG